MTQRKKALIPYAPQLFIVALLVFIWLLLRFENHCLYHPTKVDPLTQLAMKPEAYGFQEVTIETEDGEKLNAWYFPPREGKETVVHFHGNAGNIAGRLYIYQWFAKRGYGVLGLEPRGYGKSTGSPSEKGFYKDFSAASEYLTQTYQTPPQRQIAVGESLGAAVVIDGATKIPFKGVMVYSGFTSLTDMAKSTRESGQFGLLGVLPLEMIIRQPYNSISKIDQIKAPLLIVHGDQDRLTPFFMGQALFDKATTKHKKMVVVQGAGHNETIEESAVDALGELLEIADRQK